MYSLKERLRYLLDVLAIVLEFFRDCSRHLRYSAPNDGRSVLARSPRHLECQLTRDYHRVEKGLALPKPKSPFGSVVLGRLKRDLGRLDREEGEAEGLTTRLRYSAETAAEALSKWNAGTATHRSAASIVTKNFPKFDLPPRQSVREFFKSRSSVRDFSSTPVETVDLKEAAELASFSPSVCNRQAWKVWTVRDPRLVQEVLGLQNGNSGFGHTVKCVAVICVDLRLFSGSGERNQRWIDGGLFAMSYVAALHGFGLSTCMLNWSVNNARSAKLRDIMKIPENFDIVTLVAIGHARSGAIVTRSPRRPIAEIWHDIA